MFEHFPYEKVSYLIFKGSSAIEKPNFQQFLLPSSDLLTRKKILKDYSVGYFFA